MALSHNPDAEVIFAVTGDNSEVKQVLDETEAKAEKTAKETSEKIGDAADDAAEKVKKKSKETRDQLASDTQKAGKQAEKTAKDTTEKVKKQFEAGSVAIGNIISGLVTKIASAGKGLIQQGIEYNAQIEKYTTGFSNMLGNATKAREVIAKIQQDAAVTPFSVEALTKANQLLIGAGENADYSRKVILALGNAVSATGGTSVELERMAQNLQQIANVGKAASIDIKQFAYAGINIYQVLADYTGKTVQEVKDMTVSYDVLSKALIAASEEGGRYYNSMDTLSQTMDGRVQTLKDNVTQLVGVLSSGLSETVGQLITKANELTVAMKNGFQTDGIVGMMNAASEAEPKISGLTNAIRFCIENGSTLKILIGTLAGALITYKTVATAATIAQNLLNAAMSANPIGIVIGLVGALAGGMITAYNNSETFRSGVNHLKSAFDNLKSSIVNATKALIGYQAATVDDDGFGGSEGGEFTPKSAYINKTTDAELERRKKLHEQRVRKSQLEHLISSITTGDDTGGSGNSGGTSPNTTDSRQVTKTVTDTKKTVDGSIKTVTKIFDDGTKQVTTTTTKAGKEMVDGVERNVTTIETKVDEFATETATVAKETSTTVQKEITDIEEQAVKSLRDVEKELKQSLKNESSDGILGIIKDGVSNIKNQDWGGVALDVAKLIWGEVDAEQRKTITKWAGNVLKVINDEYASGGLSSVGNTIKTLLSGGELVLNTEEGATTLASISKIVSDLTASGGMGEVLGTMATKLGSLFGTLATKIGSVGTALSGLATKLVAVVAANPEIFAILAIVAGIAALGAYIWKKHGREISGWWGGLWEKKPTAVSADNYQQSDSITAARLVQESQAAAAANQQSTTRVQSGTGSAASQQLNASWRGSSTTILNLDGREVARSTAPYMDEELAFRS
nr:MAG TPA: tail tape measure protein [Caudoviricetes sp.]